MRAFTLCCALFLSGCATISDIEGLGEVGEVLRAAESTRIVLGGRPQQNNSAVVNRKMGEARSLSENVDRTDLNNLPHRIQQIKYILE